MPSLVSDFDKEKLLNLPSVSGTPSFGKAQALIVKGETAFDLSNASYDSPSISAQDFLPTDIFWKGDGSKFWEIGYDSNLIYEYTVSTAWDLSTASYTGTSISTQDSSPSDIFWKNDGTKFWEVGAGSDLIYEYEVSTAWDLSTASYTGTSISAQDGTPQGIFWKSDGSKFWEIGNGSDLIYEYYVSTPWDLSTASYTGTSISTQDSDASDIFWNDDGTKFWELGTGSDLIYEYDVGAAWDIGTATYNGKSIGTQDSAPTGIFWKNDGTKFWEIGASSAKIYEWDVGATEDKVGTGDILIDFDKVNGPQDLAIYDQFNNLLPYEIELLDLTNEIAVLWPYSSWVRDGSVQAKIVYGSNSDNTDNQNVTASRPTTDYDFSYPFNEASGTTLDRTSNNHDSTSTTGTTYDVSAEFNGGRDFDGSDDQISFVGVNPFPNSNNVGTISTWVKFDGFGSSTEYILQGQDGSGNQEISIYADSSSIIHVDIGQTEIFSYDASTDISNDTWHIIAVAYDGSNDQHELYIDDTQVATSNTAITGSNPADMYIGSSEGGNYLDGTVDEVNAITSDVSSDYIQAEYDASPKGGQTFFSQQAAQPAGGWLAFADGTNVGKVSDSVQGSTASEWKIDASKTSQDIARFEATGLFNYDASTALGSSSGSFSQGTFGLYMKIGDPGVLKSTDAVTVRLGSSDSDYAEWTLDRSALESGSYGYYSLSHDERDQIVGTPDWTNLKFGELVFNEVSGNSTDTFIYVDYLTVSESNQIGANGLGDRRSAKETIRTGT